MVDRELALELAECIIEKIEKLNNTVFIEDLLYCLIQDIMPRHTENIMSVAVNLLKKKRIKINR